MVRCPSQPLSAAPSLGGGTTRCAPLDLPACPCNARCRFPAPHMESGQAAVLLGVVEQGVIFPKDETHFRCIHRAMSQSSRLSWLHTFASACLSGRCCSPGTASFLADSQRLTGSLVDPEGLPVQLDPSSIPSYSFHCAHMDITTNSRPHSLRMLYTTPAAAHGWSHS